MRLWEFDRLGVVGSTPFDINQEGETFIMVILGILWMSEEELGFDPTIMEGDGRYMQIRRNGGMERIQLEARMRHQRSLAGRATTCWSGSLYGRSDGQLAIKDSWEYEERSEEGLLLKEATEAGVKNVARYYHHETVLTNDGMDDILTNVRKGMSDTVGRNPLQQQRAAHSESILGSRTWVPPPKQSCSDSPVKQDTPRRRNRVHRRLIMQDVGKSIYEASSP
jgi:hypothetical protein